MSTFADIQHPNTPAEINTRSKTQERFWEHLVRDTNDLGECTKYVWYNPVKHGLVKCLHDWLWSTFRRAVKAGWIDNSWCCSCGDEKFRPPRDIPGAEMD